MADALRNRLQAIRSAVSPSAQVTLETEARSLFTKFDHDPDATVTSSEISDALHGLKSINRGVFDLQVCPAVRLSFIPHIGMTSCGRLRRHRTVPDLHPRALPAPSLRLPTRPGPCFHRPAALPPHLPTAPPPHRRIPPSNRRSRPHSSLLRLLTRSALPSPHHHLLPSLCYARPRSPHSSARPTRTKRAC